MSYWDTSTLVKLYTQEPESATFEKHALTTAAQAVTSRIALYEARATFQRKEADGALQVSFRPESVNRSFRLSRITHHVHPPHQPPNPREDIWLKTHRQLQLIIPLQNVRFAFPATKALPIHKTAQ